MNAALVWSIAGLTIAGVLLRPRDWPEAVWASLGAIVLVTCRLLPLAQAGIAIGKGTDVYLFLTGMMLLSELARREGVFHWLAALAVTAARGSRTRLFGLIYLVGIGVTVFLSNDATAVVLTPAVYAAVQRARTPAMPYLLICAFIANAASFVLPISNPANLVVYGKNLPALLPWMQTFLVPSLCAILATYLALRWTQRTELKGIIEDSHEPAHLSKQGRFAAWSILAMGLVLLGFSAYGLSLGLPTFLVAALAVLLSGKLRQIAVGVSWSVLPLVGGLFVIVEALNHAGALQDVGRILQWCATLPTLAGSLAGAFSIAGLSNVMNNLPSGLLSGGALQAVHVPPHIRDAVLIGVDLGPNLSVTGSLATVLWLIALRREGEHINAWQFLKTGLIVMPPALLLSVVAVSLLAR